MPVALLWERNNWVGDVLVHLCLAAVGMLVCWELVDHLTASEAVVALWEQNLGISCGAEAVATATCDWEAAGGRHVLLAGV